MRLPWLIHSSKEFTILPTFAIEAAIRKTFPFHSGREQLESMDDATILIGDQLGRRSALSDGSYLIELRDVLEAEAA